MQASASCAIVVAANPTKAKTAAEALITLFIMILFLIYENFSRTKVKNNFDYETFRDC